MPWSLVDVHDVAAHAAGHVTELALLIGRGLIQGRDTEIENGAFRRNAYVIPTSKNARFH
jgi:hypothetical protein